MKFRAALIAILVASVGSLLLWVYLKRFEAEASGGPPILVLIVLKTLEPGSILKDEDIGERPVPQAYVESRAVRATDRMRIANLRIAAPLEAQQTLMWTDIIVVANDRRDLSALVQPSMRATTVHAEGKAATLARPGDRVDVIATFAQPGAEHRTGVVLMQNVLVLGRDPGTGTNGSAEGGDMALSLSLHNAQLLAVAADKGKISIALRSPDDVRIQEGLVDISSAILVEAEKRAAAPVHSGRRGPAKMESAPR